MTLPLGMILFGALLVYAGWTGEPVRKLIAGGTIAAPKKAPSPRAPQTPAPGGGVVSSSPDSLMDGVLV